MSKGREEGRVPSKRRPIPRFKSLREESDFWDTHSFLDVGEWDVVPYDEICKEMGSRSDPKVSVTLRLEKGLVKQLKEAGHRYGVKYQALAREILWQSLSRKAQ